MTISPLVPIILLKTRSQPHDVYEEYFSTASSATNPTAAFEPVFIPVLEHKQDEGALASLGALLKSGKLKEKYGGMIFTSQRAVEAWAETVKKIERELRDEPIVQQASSSRSNGSHSTTQPSDEQVDRAAANSWTLLSTATDTRSNRPFTTDISTSVHFPLYTVGPATSRALNTLLLHSSSFSSTTTTTSSSSTEISTASRRRTPSPFTRLQPEILGSHTGNGANLAVFILDHYNTQHARRWFTYYEAPRLPFIPLLGMGSENYSRKRLEADDPRLAKLPLLFLVGEQRRDIIPRTLADQSRRGPDGTIVVDEVEVYSTQVMDSFTSDLDRLMHAYKTERRGIVVIVVFSPQGSGEMLRSVGLVDDHFRLTERGKSRWTGRRRELSKDDDDDEDKDNVEVPTYVIATIGPTTRDFLRDRFEFEADVCASKPSPEGLGEDLVAFLKSKGVTR